MNIYANLIILVGSIFTMYNYIKDSNEKLTEFSNKEFRKFQRNLYACWFTIDGSALALISSILDSNLF